MDRPDSRPQQLWSHPVLITVVASAAVSTVASLLSIPVFASSVLVDVVARVTWLPVVDKALLDWGRLLALRGRLLVDRNLSPMLRRLGAFFCGCPSTLGG